MCMAGRDLTWLIFALTPRLSIDDGSAASLSGGNMSAVSRTAGGRGGTTCVWACKGGVFILATDWQAAGGGGCPTLVHDGNKPAGDAARRCWQADRRWGGEGEAG